MKFFGGKKPSSSSASKKHAPSPSVDDRPDVRHLSHSEPASPAKSSTAPPSVSAAPAAAAAASPNKAASSPKKSSRPVSYRDSARDAASPKPSAPRTARLSRHSTERRSTKFDADIHPLNLPPEERKRYSAALANSAAMSGISAMDIDREPANGAAANPSSPPQQASNPSAQANFAVPISNGASHPTEAPVPPPHKSNPSSPAPSPHDEAEAYKAAGNRFFKDRNYSKAIEQYSKGKTASPPHPSPADPRCG